MNTYVCSVRYKFYVVPPYVNSDVLLDQLCDGLTYFKCLGLVKRILLFNIKGCFMILYVVFLCLYQSKGASDFTMLLKTTTQ